MPKPNPVKPLLVLPPGDYMAAILEFLLFVGLSGLGGHAAYIKASRELDEIVADFAMGNARED